MDYQQLAPPPPPPPSSAPNSANILHQVTVVQQQQQQHTSAATNQQQPHPHIVVAPALQAPPSSQIQALTNVQHAHQIHGPLPSIHDDSASSRWSQYQHIWRQHHVYINGTGIIYTGYKFLLQFFFSYQ